MTNARARQATLVTYEMWVRPSQLPSTGRVGLVELDGVYGVFIYAGGEVRCRLSLGGLADDPVSTAAVSVGTWTHLACVVDAGVARLYVDGLEADAQSYTSGLPARGGVFTIGSNAPTVDENFIGDIDGVRIWARALTDAEIAAAAGL